MWVPFTHIPKPKKINLIPIKVRTTNNPYLYSQFTLKYLIDMFKFLIYIYICVCVCVFVLVN